MKVSELIAQLQNAQRLLGDADVEVLIEADDLLMQMNPNLVDTDFPIDVKSVEPMPGRHSYITLHVR